MTNLYVIQDRVSGVFGSVFESHNDDVVKRDFIANLVSNSKVPDFAVFDVVVIHLGSFDQNERNPSICPVSIPRVVFRGDDNEFRKMREEIFTETSS